MTNIRKDLTKDKVRQITPTSAQLRGDIQAGLTGDKQPGFDPAMAPLETDAEAGGTTLREADLAIERREQRSGRTPEVSADYGSAMRPVFSGNRPNFPWFWHVFAIALMLTCVVTVAIAFVFRG